MDGSASVGCVHRGGFECAQRGSPVSGKIENAHTESSELCLQHLAILDICLVARWSPIFSLIMLTGSCLKLKSREKSHFFKCKTGANYGCFLVKIENAHTENSELRPHNLALLDIYLVARWSPIFSLIG